MSRYLCRAGDENHEIDVVRVGDRYQVTAADGRSCPVHLDPIHRALRQVRVGDRELTVGVLKQDGLWIIVLDGIEHRIDVADARLAAIAAARVGRDQSMGSHARVVAPIPGMVVRLLVAQGEKIARDQPLLVLDAMKLENEILAPRAGTVAEVFASPGQIVEKGALLLSIA